MCLKQKLSSSYNTFLKMRKKHLFKYKRSYCRRLILKHKSIVSRYSQVFIRYKIFIAHQIRAFIAKVNKN